MTTENPQDENKSEETVEQIDLTASAKPNTPDAEAEGAPAGVDPVESPNTGDANVEVSAESTEPAAADAPETEAEAPAESSEEAAAESSVPQLTLGGGVEGEESAEEGGIDPNFQPVIRGRVDKDGTAIGTGRRKTSVARVRVRQGNGKITVNGRDFSDFFRIERDRAMIEAPLKAVDELGKVDVWVRVNGGGITGQTGAVVLGIARALQARNPECHHTLAEGGYLTRDGRMVERKKYGKRKARRSFQFSKR